MAVELVELSLWHCHWQCHFASFYILNLNVTILGVQPFQLIGYMQWLMIWACNSFLVPQGGYVVSNLGSRAETEAVWTQHLHRGGRRLQSLNTLKRPQHVLQCVSLGARCSSTSSLAGPVRIMGSVKKQNTQTACYLDDVIL